MPSPNLQDVVTRRVSAAKLRLTASRRSVLQVLIDAERPLTLPEILGRGDGLAQSSAYRNLAELIGAGVVERIDTGDDHSHYELADDLTAHHHHLICTGCGRVVDVELSDDLEHRLHEAADEVGPAEGFSVTGHRLDLTGLCRSCS